MFYDRFVSLCDDKGVKPSVAAREIGFNKSTVSAWKRNGTTPNREILSKIANYFAVSVDHLLGNTDDPTPLDKKTPALTKKDERDIAKDLESFMGEMENSEALMFDGNPMSEEARESILAAMKLGLEVAKSKNKERFTPKKYRKD